MKEVFHFKAPFGWLSIETKDGVLWKISFIQKKPRVIRRPQNSFECEVAGQLREYLAGDRKDFELPFALEGTRFQSKAWLELWKMPYGTVQSYKNLAERVGKPKAFRAVARAMATNKIPLVLPCHRIVGSHQKLGGFAGGISTKQWLLKLEESNSDIH